MEEKNRKSLLNAIAGLPEHEPDPEHWIKVEAFLEFEDKLKQSLPELPVHEPSELLWNRIEDRLEPDQKEIPARVIPIFRYVMAVAASVAVLLVGTYLLRQHGREQVQVAYSVEEVYQQPGVLAETNEQDPGLIFIKEQCSQQPDICQKPEFVELQSQLAQLESDDRKLKQDLQLYGEDPMLVQSQIKIENLRSEITKELIQLIIS